MLLAGSDITNEACTTGLKADAVMAVKGLRFALATKPELVDAVTGRIANGDRVDIGTEYPATVVKTLGMSATKVWKGKSEGMIDYYGPNRIQAVFGLVQSGKTLETNGLVIVEDDIEQVNVMRVVAEEADDYSLADKLPQPMTGEEIAVACRRQSERLLRNAKI